MLIQMLLVINILGIVAMMFLYRKSSNRMFVGFAMLWAATLPLTIYNVMAH